MLPQVNNYKFLIVCCFCFLTMSCGSTKLGNNLGTTVSGQGNQLVFAWQSDHPFAANYQRDPIIVVAEYVEIDTNGNKRNVRQYLTPRHSRHQVSQSAANIRSFQLLSQLPSPPDRSSPICLYMESKGQVIPIRDPSLGETARFRFPEWEQSVRKNTVSLLAERDLSIARNNVTVLSDQLSAIKRNLNTNLNDFNRQLANEGLANTLDISQANQCPNIQLANSTQKRPYDVLEENQIPVAAREICSFRTFNGLYVPSGGVKALVLAYLAIITPEKTFSVNDINANRETDFVQFLKILDAHKKKVLADDYNPQLGSKNDYIRFSAHAVSMQPSAIQALEKVTTLTANEIAIINQVLAAELDVFSSCIDEGEQQLKTKRIAWEKQVAASPQRRVAREAFLQQRCESLFVEAEQNLQRTEEALIKAKNELAKLESFYGNGTASSSTSTVSANLNLLQCQL